MSIKGFRILWIKLQFEHRRFCTIPFPIPLFIFQEILDCVLDLITIACFFLPGRKGNYRISSSPYSVATLRELIGMTMQLLDSLTEGEPYDLVDVTADKVRVSIRIR
ncbi:MAG: hypothetical protein K0S47_270 [Herbinix sp.]|jgi:hypothetical protein|nr:hypothetical protein [Herbinix sp.]